MLGMHTCMGRSSSAGQEQYGAYPMAEARGLRAKIGQRGRPSRAPCTGAPVRAVVVDSAAPAAGTTAQTAEACSTRWPGRGRAPAAARPGASWLVDAAGDRGNQLHQVPLDNSGTMLRKHFLQLDAWAFGTGNSLAMISTGSQTFAARNRESVRIEAAPTDPVSLPDGSRD